jgi:hypothetical protein
MGQVLFKGEIITRMQKVYDVILKFCPREPLSQNRSYLHESSLTYCRLKFVQIMVPKGQEGLQEGKLFLHLYIGKNLKMKVLANFKPFLHERKSSLFK